MDPFAHFYQFLTSIVTIPEREYNDWLRPCLVIREFPKKQQVTALGEVEEHLNFLSKGLARQYFKSGNEEANIQIATEGELIYSHISFYSGKASEYVVETIEPCIMVSLTRSDLESLYAQNNRMERIGRLLATFTLINSELRQLNLVRQAPRERFLEFVTENPELLQRVPQKYLASYLNIQPETFSRFKHLLKAKKEEPQGRMA